VLNTLGFALLGSGAVTDARKQFTRSLAVSREHGYRYFEAQARTCLHRPAGDDRANGAGRVIAAAVEAAARERSPHAS